MRHFLPKCTSSSAASNHPRPVPTQQTAKPMPATPEPRPPESRRDRGRSRSARRYPFPKRQVSRPKITLDPAPQKSSWSARQKEEGPESRYRCTTPEAASNVLVAIPLSAGCRGKCVFGSPRADFSARVSNRCDFRQNKTHTFSFADTFPALMQPVFTAISTSCHAGRGLAGHSRCVRMGNGCDKTRLYSPIRSKTTALPLCARHHSA